MSCWESVESISESRILPLYHQDLTCWIPYDTEYCGVEFALSHDEKLKIKTPTNRGSFEYFQKEPYDIVGRGLYVLVPSHVTMSIGWL